MEKEKISDIKQQCFSSIDGRADAIFELGRALFAHPELGFKEFETKKLLLEFLKKEGFTVQQEYARTGFQVSIGSGKYTQGMTIVDDADAEHANVRLLGHCVDVKAYNAYFMENLKILNERI